MKLKPGITVEKYPPKLKELVIQRASSDDLSSILRKAPNSLFIFTETPEGSEWWWKVVDGKEFEWEEEPVKNKFQIGDYVKYNDDNCRGEAYVVKKGEGDYKGHYLVEIGKNGWAYYDRNGENSAIGTCRWFKEKNLIKTIPISTGTQIIIEDMAKEVKPDIPHRELERNMGIYYQLQEEAPKYFYLAGIDPYDAFGAKSNVEKLPREILIKTKKKKKRYYYE